MFVCIQQSAKLAQQLPRVQFELFNFGLSWPSKMARGA